jgi:hypothetical protein
MGKNQLQELEECKQIIKELLQTYVYSIDDEGQPSTSFLEIIQLIQKAEKII